MKIGAKIHRVRICSSTNDLARDLALAGEKEGAIVISEEQTKGRGTKGRSWHSAKKKGLYLSIILRPFNSNISLLPIVAGVAVKEAIFKSLGIHIKLKWPNDLIWSDKKLGGILCESTFFGNQINFVILGIGLNLNHGVDDFPEDIRYQSTSLKLISKEDINEKMILQHLSNTLNHWYSLYLQGAERKIIQAFQENSVLPLGKDVIVVTDSKKVAGVYRGINLQGGLILESQERKIVFFQGKSSQRKRETGGINAISHRYWKHQYCYWSIPGKGDN